MKFASLGAPASPRTRSRSAFPARRGSCISLFLYRMFSGCQHWPIGCIFCARIAGLTNACSGLQGRVFGASSSPSFASRSCHWRSSLCGAPSHPWHSATIGHNHGNHRCNTSCAKPSDQVSHKHEMLLTWSLPAPHSQTTGQQGTQQVSKHHLDSARSGPEYVFTC